MIVLSSNSDGEGFGPNVSIAFEEGCNIHDYMDYFRRFLIACTFDPEGVSEAFADVSDELNQEVDKEI